MQIFKIIRENGKKYFDRIRNERLKQNLLQAIPFWIASLIAGLIAVFYSKIFALSEQLSLYIFHQANWAIFITAPVMFCNCMDNNYKIFTICKRQWYSAGNGSN